ncbi:MAG TPA: NADPH-dependent glutamate synthase [Candidatus Bathyarchaeia archaeon]|nr:NADPH-dependent glutamate synthase [Candidatus Bathyarchaeia archaeon]
MIDYDVKYLKFKTYLNTYCPYCRNSFNIKEKEIDHIDFIGVYKGQEFDLKLSPYLDVFEVESSIPLEDGMIVDDFLCPKCRESLIAKDTKCGECGSKVSEVIISAFHKLIPFFICMKYGCKWHGLTKADERRIKLKIPRQTMPEQDQILRVHNFNEVPYGLTTELALLEAGRCLQCKIPQCVEGCPVNINIPEFVRLIAEEKIEEAVIKVKERNLYPAICGRVCPQESQCESTCILGKKDDPVAIGHLERFVADYERRMNLRKPYLIPNKINKRIVVVGTGPAGLTVAADLILLGYSVTLYEALHEPGGVLTYGIPEFRLPKSIVNYEIEFLKSLGCRIDVNTVVGYLYTIDELSENFDAVFLGVGAGLPRFMGIPGENLCSVFSANEYLTRMNLMKAYKFPEYDTPLPKGEKVVVIGGGNVAMDCARSAKRSGAGEVTIVYRRSRKELPARHEEVRHAEEEGINFKLLTNPVKFIGDDRNWIKEMECILMELGPPDDSGRRRPIPIENSNFTIPCDMAIVAIGNQPNPILFNTTPTLERNQWGCIAVNEETMETSIPNVYAGGDIVTGAATVISAMGQGRIAANAIHERLSNPPKQQKKEKIVQPKQTIPKKENNK